MLGVERLHLGLLEVGVQLDLVDGGDDLGHVKQVREVPGHEVADADGADLAVLEQRLQCPVSLERLAEVRRQRLVQDQQVDLVDAELAGALVEGVQRLVISVVADPDLGLQEDRRATTLRRVHRFADLALVAVCGGRVDVAVAGAERGRAILHGQALDTRTDLTELRISHPASAHRFTQLRDALESAADDSALADLMATAGSPAPARQDRHRVAAQFAELQDEIRRLPSFGSFLLPPEPEESVRHASRGPIVVFNVSRSRSDALIVTT